MIALTGTKRHSGRYYFMRNLLLFIAASAVLCSCVPSGSQDVFTVSAYNMYLFFDDTDDGWEYEGFRRSDGYTAARYDERIHDTAVFIAKNMPSDVIILSEVESEIVLNDLLEAGLRKKGYSHYGLASDGSSPLSVGFISKEEPLRSAVHSTDGERPVIDLTFSRKSGTIRVFGIHARSRLEEQNEDIRRRQFEHLRFLVDSADEDLVITAGDFNADPRYPEAGIAEYPVSDISAIPVVVTGDPGLVRHGALYSPFLDDEENGGHEGSYHYQGKWYFLDNILVDQKAFDGKGLEYDSAAVVAPFEAQDILSRPLAYDASTGRGYSDHFGLTIRFSTFL